MPRGPVRGKAAGLTLPAVLNIVSASVGLLAALLALGMSSAPGWRELRWFAACAAFAALFNVANVPNTAVAPDDLRLLASRLTLFFGGLHAATWFKYVAARSGRKLSRFEAIWVAGGLGFSVLALVPGLVVESHLVPRPVPWLGVVYVDAPPTAFGILAILYYEVSIAILFMRAVSRWGTKDPHAKTLTIALGAVLAGGVHDGFASTDIIRSPYLLDLSLLVLVLAVGGSIASGFVAGARALVESAHQLEAAQEELVKKERLAALGELAAVVAHEVRNPLAVVFNATAGLRRAKPGSTDHEALIGIVQEEAERLRDMVSDLLEFAAPRPPVLAAAAFGELVRGAVETARSVVGVAASEIVLEVNESVGQVECDERLVRQAIVNLVTNALQAVGRCSPVRVIVVDDETSKGLEVRVSDDGAGVPRDLRDRIFTPFFTTQPKGTGLGLAVVRRCAEAHNGSVLLRYTEGGGATFELRLPLRSST